MIHSINLTWKLQKSSISEHIIQTVSENWINLIEKIWLQKIWISVISKHAIQTGFVNLINWIIENHWLTESLESLIWKEQIDPIIKRII